MKSKTMILMVAAVACGLVASYLTSRMLAQQQPADEEKVKVLVARQKIALGTLIRDPEKFFVEKEFIKGQEPKAALTSFDQLKDKRLAKTINADYHLTNDDLMDKDKNPSIQNQIPPGFRALALTVRADTNVAGFVLPDARVDVVFTQRAGEKDSISKTILQNMRVLAVDTKDTRENEKAMPANTVTLLVKPEEAEVITMARGLGDLSLVLRGFDDTERINTLGKKPGDIIKMAGNATGSGDGSSDGEGKPLLPGGIPDVKPPDQKTAANKPEEPPPPPPAPKTHTLTIFNGESVTRAVYVEGEADTRIEKSEPEVAPPVKTPPAKAADSGSAPTDPTPPARTGGRTPRQRVGQ
jgi:pilus assembly protein CpaB